MAVLACASGIATQSRPSKSPTLRRSVIYGIRRPHVRPRRRITTAAQTPNTPRRGLEATSINSHGLPMARGPRPRQVNSNMLDTQELDRRLRHKALLLAAARSENAAMRENIRLLRHENAALKENHDTADQLSPISVQCV
ncbi:hypothetical protein [Castellaniella sp. S9]|uniref:hypothetical protein n=1 Tax=Castellaniella sp. S9 TaxID=2993652 RepID=UPI0022B31F93|nr:hypothetical protein [Castellaniella sp. S9]